MDELSYDTVFTVIESWEALRRKKNFSETLGRGLFVKFFEERPDAKAVFGFDYETSSKSGSDDDSDNNVVEDPLYNSEKFLDIAKNFVNFVDQIVDMLGPDFEPLTEIFVDLGEKYHLTKYNLDPKFYPMLGRALLGQLDDMLGPEVFTIHIRACWLKVFQAISLDITSTTVEKEVEPPPPRLKKKSPRIFPKSRRKSGEKAF